MPNDYGHELGLVADARYILDVYQEADDLLREFDSTDSTASLINAAATLCHGLRKLEDDAAFWAGLDRFLVLSRPEQDELLAGLENIDRLVGLERRVLIECGMSERSAADLAREAAHAVIGVREYPDARAFRLVRDSLTRARRAACLRASREFSATERARFPAVRRVMRVAGGFVIITADAAIAVGTFGEASPAAATSIIAGVQLARTGFPPSSADQD